MPGGEIEMKHLPVILAIAFLIAAAPARADEVTVWGSASGAIQGIPLLAFRGHDFTVTTNHGVGYLSGPNSIGTFALGGIGAQVSGTFTLDVSISAPPGITGGPGLARKSAITAKITKDESCGGVWIHFSNPSSRLSFDNGSVKGSFTVSLADVTVKPHETAALVAVVTGAQEADVRCPMQFSAAMAKPVLLQPATQKMTPVWIRTAVSDNPGCGLTCKIAGVASNESASPEGDWQITGDLSLNLRAAREASGGGRIYSVAVECADNAGNKVTKTAPVAVPRPKAQ
jgi:hypothetical protein